MHMTLSTPVAGRVEYKLVQAGEVVGAGGRLVTILDLTDVF
jgi:HlyD family secretion protein